MPLLACCLIALIFYLCKPCIRANRKVALHHPPVTTGRTVESDSLDFHRAVTSSNRLPNSVGLPGDNLPPSYESIFPTSRLQTA